MTNKKAATQTSNDNRQHLILFVRNEHTLVLIIENKIKYRYHQISDITVFRGRCLIIHNAIKLQIGPERT